ncbi:conserved uncharacterized protein [Nannochloropsis gaditana]|uniref:Conserved uncharacterized protein n=1 Tax=Nannochloropsis gaditana TaxID=72520 RepID=W7TEW1_9STRA|nr:conserved uncharacterized protein [Nannochloropsis gaditana]
MQAGGPRAGAPEAGDESRPSIPPGASPDTEGGRGGRGTRSKLDYRVTFKVVLLYPQLNFRSQHANGSFIIAAQEAYMEGRQHEKLFRRRCEPFSGLTPALGPARPPVKLLAKVEQWLRIENMRAYVVPLDVEVTREVHWLEVVPASDEPVLGEEEKPGASTKLTAMMGMVEAGGGGGPGGKRERESSRSASPSASLRSLSPLAAAMGIGRVGFGKAFAGKGGKKGASSETSSPGHRSDAQSTHVGNRKSNSTSGRGKPSSARPEYAFQGSAVVQEVVKDFGLTFASIAFKPAALPKAGSREVSAFSQSLEESGGSRCNSNGEKVRRIRISSEETVAKVLLDLPQLDWNLNSRQFYITLDVIRNVLLAAPVQTEEEEAEERIRREQQEAKRIAEARQRVAAVAGLNPGEEKGGLELALEPEHLDLGSKSDRDVLKTLVEQTLQRLLLPTLHETKMVQYCVGGGTWKVKAEEGMLTKYDALEIGFTGFSGQHVYFHDGSMDSTVQVESFWVRNVMPGPDSVLFKDDVTTVMSPVVRDKQPCQRCGAPFEEESNRATSCVFHGCADGTPGEFRLLTEAEIESQHRRDCAVEEGGEGGGDAEGLDGSGWPVAGTAPARRERREAQASGFSAETLDSSGPPLSGLHRHASYQRLQVLRPTTGRWTCCRATYETAPGCRARAHVAKEVMLSVRAKSHAPLFVAGYEVHPYQFMDVSIFPGADYKLTFQLTRNIVELLHAYFLTQDVTGPVLADDAAQTTDLLFGRSVLEQKHKAGKEKKGTYLTDRFAKNFMGGEKPSSSASPRASTASPRSSPHKSSSASLVSNTNTTVASTASGGSVVKGDTPKEPVIYMRYLRWGDLNVKLSVNGFALKFDGYRASIPAFVQQGKILSWKRLIRKFEKHVVWSVTTSAAASMVSGGGKGKGNYQLANDGAGGWGERDGSKLSPNGNGEDEKERGVNTLFSPPPMEDRSKLLFGKR